MRGWRKSFWLKPTRHTGQHSDWMSGLRGPRELITRADTIGAKIDDMPPISRSPTVVVCLCMLCAYTFTGRWWEERIPVGTGSIIPHSPSSSVSNECTLSGYMHTDIQHTLLFFCGTKWNFHRLYQYCALMRRKRKFTFALLFWIETHCPPSN